MDWVFGRCCFLLRLCACRNAVCLFNRVTALWYVLVLMHGSGLGRSWNHDIDLGRSPNEEKSCFTSGEFLASVVAFAGLSEWRAPSFFVPSSGPMVAKYSTFWYDAVSLLCWSVLLLRYLGRLPCHGRVVLLPSAGVCTFRYARPASSSGRCSVSFPLCMYDYNATWRR